MCAPAGSALPGSAFLYMKVIPMNQIGEYTLSLWERLDGTKNTAFFAVASATVKVSKEPETFWSPWGEPKAEETAMQEAVANYRMMDVANPDTGIALPKWEGEEPVLIEKLPDAKLPLPQLLPAKPDAGIKLSVKDNQLIVKLDDDVSDYFLDEDETFLTRWWVNGKPFIPKLDTPALRNRARAAAQAANAGSEVEVRFQVEFHPEFLGLKKGDTVGVQLLYCPHGWECTGPELIKEAAAAMQKSVPIKAEQIHISRLSNRVDFVYSGNPKAMVQTPAKH